MLRSIYAAIWFQFQLLRYEYLKRKNEWEIARDMRKAGLL